MRICDCTPADWGITNNGSKADQKRIEAYTDHKIAHAGGPLSGAETTPCRTRGKKSSG